MERENSILINYDFPQTGKCGVITRRRLAVTSPLVLGPVKPPRYENPPKQGLEPYNLSSLYSGNQNNNTPYQGPCVWNSSFQDNNFACWET